MFIRFLRIHERDGHRQTDRRTPNDDIGRACIAPRGKKHTDEQNHGVYIRKSIQEIC